MMMIGGIRRCSSCRSHPLRTAPDNSAPTQNHQRNQSPPNPPPQTPPELAQQVQRVLRALIAAGLRFRCSIMTGGQEEEGRRSKALRTQEEALERGVDVVVATPGRVVGLLEKGVMRLEATRAVVLDEVDVLCGEWAFEGVG